MATTAKATYRSVKRASVVKMILSNARRGVTTVVTSHTGNSKSAIVKDLQKLLPTHEAVVINMSQMQAGDMLMPKFEVVNGRAVVSGVPHEQFGFHLDKPVILLLDEIYKAPKALQVQVADLVNSHTIGVHKLAEGSIVFGASNLEAEGFHDSSMSYFLDRIAEVEMAKVTGEEWIADYALDNDIHPSVIAAAKEFPQMFADFRDYNTPGTNQYIFDPRMPQRHFVSLRSLERASKAIYGYEEDELDHADMAHGLSNIVGPRAAADILAIHKLKEDLPNFEDCISKPGKAKVPESAGARILLMYTALQKVDGKNIEAWLKYMERGFRKEEQALFASSILNMETKAATVCTNAAFIEWGKKNSYLYFSK